MLGGAKLVNGLCIALERRTVADRDRYNVMPPSRIDHRLEHEAGVAWTQVQRASPIELFRNKRQGKLSSQKTMGGVKRWVYLSETTVR